MIIKSMLKWKTFDGGEAIKLADGGEVPKKIQLLKVGAFKSAEYGELNITKDILLSMKKNFEGKARGYDDGHLPIDYFHENEKVAAGWIEGLTLSDDGAELWADVTWTPRGEKHLADKELRYVSAEFHFDYKSNEGGKKFGPTLFGAGLTNRPFIKGMEAVVELSEGAGESMTLEQAMAKIADLEKKIAEMGKGETEMSDMKKKLSEYEASAKKSEEDKKLAEKKSDFDKRLSEGKVCEAQREPFMSGDLVKFSDLQQTVKLDSKGNAGSGDDGKGADHSKSETPAQDEVMALAEAAMASDKKIKLSDAIQSVLREKPELATKYRTETSIR